MANPRPATTKPSRSVGAINQERSSTASSCRDGEQVRLFRSRMGLTCPRHATGVPAIRRHLTRVPGSAEAEITLAGFALRQRQRAWLGTSARHSADHAVAGAVGRRSGHAVHRHPSLHPGGGAAREKDPGRRHHRLRLSGRHDFRNGDRLAAGELPAAPRRLRAGGDDRIFDGTLQLVADAARDCPRRNSTTARNLRI